MRTHRRNFLKGAAATIGAAATVTIAGTKAAGKVLGANDTVRVCVAGINGRGQEHIQQFAKMKNVRVTHLVDPDSRLFGPRGAQVEKFGGNKPECFQDLRKALEGDAFDCVSIASCNHWHSLLSIWAMQAGRDVYVEKPVSHNIFEGRKVVETARKHSRICQHGTQSRSEANWAKQVAAAASGKYGKLLVAYGYASKPRGSLGFKQPEAPPAELDFDLWLGPAPQQPFHRNIVPYNWHWFWDFGNGEIGNQGVHQMDIARWAITRATGLTGPKSVISLGGRFGYKDQGQTPNTQLTVFDFGPCKLIFEDRGLKTNKVTNEFLTDAGMIRSGKFFPKDSDKTVALEDVEFTVHPNGNFGNFIDCVRSRKQEALNAEILEGHLSASLCHLGNISYRLGTDAALDKDAPALATDKDGAAALESMKKHLVDAAGVDLAKTQYRVGRALAWDAKAERFPSDDEANKMLTREYRKAYVVPDAL